MRLYIVSRIDTAEKTTAIVRIFLFKRQADKFTKKFSPMLPPQFPYHSPTRYKWEIRKMHVSFRL